MFNKSHFLTHSRIIATALCGAAFALGALAPPAQADQWDKKTVLTIDQPIQVTKTVLPPGQYVFKLLDSQSDRHIVQIFNTRMNHLYATVLAINNYRLEPEGHSRFAFWETPAGHVKALRAWFYPGDNFGQEFAYPKHLALAETTTTASNTMTTESTQTTQTQPENNTADRSMEETTPVPQTETQPMTEQQQATESRPVETAENTPPPPPAVQSAPSTQEQPAETPRRLPKTGSPYPLIGLFGLSMLGLYGFLRRKQHA